MMMCYQGEPFRLNLECHNGSSLSSGEISLLNDLLCIVKLSETERLNGFQVAIKEIHSRRGNRCKNFCLKVARAKKDGENARQEAIELIF